MNYVSFNDQDNQGRPVLNRRYFSPESAPAVQERRHAYQIRTSPQQFSPLTISTPPPCPFDVGNFGQAYLPTPPRTPENGPFDDGAMCAPAWQPTYFDAGHKLQFQSVLGTGAYGVVYLANDVTTGFQYAVKGLNKFGSNGKPIDRRSQQFQQTEMALHYQVSAHPNIVSLRRILDTPDCTYVVLDYCQEGDLFSNITEKGRYIHDFHAAKSAFLQILDAVSHCHSLGVYHRDLKPENILVAEGGHQVRLADFGLATTDEYSTDFGCGSTFYMSPECQDQSAKKPFYACAPNDIWSLGVILVNLTCGRNPWRVASAKDSTFRAFVGDRNFLKSILPLSDELNEILGMIFELDPSKRITLDQLRYRIMACQSFNKEQQVAAVTIAAEYQEPLSPTSTLSDEGSMISDHSDDSCSPSEADSVSTPHYEALFDVVDPSTTTDYLPASDPYAQAYTAVRPKVPSSASHQTPWFLAPSCHAQAAPSCNSNPQLLIQCPQTIHTFHGY
ncbi:MAG: hypothetical protein M1818_005495 [Claussenomyces sp. TS43310]|nr:MAG: hypothetical protein M1818_005495 [Claussenomyces sp. TS43310]